MYIEKNVIQEDESWGEYTKIDKDNKPVSKEQREKERRHWNKKNIGLILIVKSVFDENISFSRLISFFKYAKRK